MSLLDHLVSSEIIDASYAWLCERRHDYSANSDIWDLRWNWESERPRIVQQLLDGSYHFSPLREYRFVDGRREIWSAQDALGGCPRIEVVARES